MRLSRRSAWPTEPSAWARAVERAHARGELLDLSGSNPTELELLHPAELLAALGDPGGARYAPEPMGLASAREAVAEHYARRGRAVDPDRVWLCASTSEAYAMLLTLLGDPGDALLVPRPGYPLLDMLGDATGLRRVPYALRFDGAWYLDATALQATLAAEPRARALVVVAPGNPTGHVPDPDEWNRLRATAAAHGLPLLVDEVFADYPLGDRPARVPVLDDGGPCLVLSGLSKVAALPQLKLSWVVMHGAAPELAELRRRAELLADAFLSVATPVQRALPALLHAAETMQPRIRARLCANLEQLRRARRGTPVDLLPATGGWTALLRLPALPGLDDLAWAERLLEAGVLIQPGFLFDLPAPPRVALSLLTPEPTFARGVARLLETVRTVT
ncbi:MAG: pyridoxal phosphate-dependent aminotransferase [Myxococcales bacterium]|nr:pyridoxal phosphate-dependent aminotransferase [Myxococcales bacterium]